MNTKQIIDIGIKVTLATAVVILFILHLQAEQSLVYVDAQKLVIGYKGMQEARKEFEDKTLVWKANLDTLRNEAESKMKEYEQKKEKLSTSERKLMEELIQARQQQFVNYQQVVQEKIKKEDEELTAHVLDKVNDYIKRYGKEKGYRIILAATQYGNIVYAREGMEVTEDVLKGLNAEFGK